MTAVEASVEIEAPLAEVWGLYFDPGRWSAWVDGFEAADSTEGGYPDAGGELVWHSNAAGRGRVRERVVAHEPRTLQRIAFEDPQAAGELETTFEMLPAGDGGSGRRRTRVTQQLTYSLRGGGPLRVLTDRLFIRGQMRGSLVRSLSELRRLAEGGARGGGG